MIRPSHHLLTASFLWVLLAVAGSFWPQFALLWLLSAGVLITVAVLDFFLCSRRQALVLTRRLPGRFALGEDAEVMLDIRNRTGRNLELEVFDHVPDSAEARELPWSGKLGKGSFLQLSYPVRMLERGRVTFGMTELLASSPLRLWKKRLFLGKEEEVKVYPNYEPLVELALLATDQRIEQMGIIRKNRIGISKEFHQLRDYHQGDSLNQIDWKSSARRLELISREYQEQRDQTVILAVDSGRRMRAVEGELSQFDHCLNSMLLLSYIALRQGDNVGVIKFGGEQRWLPPVKGVHQMPVLLNHLYDYETTLEPSDFREAAERIMVAQQKRALVIVLTNLRGEDRDDLSQSLAQLRRRHLVVLASLREEGIDQVIGDPDITSLDEALTLAGTKHYVDERKSVLATLRQGGIQTIDETAADLPIALCNRYLDIKAEL